MSVLTHLCGLGYLYFFLVLLVSCILAFGFHLFELEIVEVIVEAVNRTLSRASNVIIWSFIESFRGFERYGSDFFSKFFGGGVGVDIHSKLRVTKIPRKVVNHKTFLSLKTDIKTLLLHR